MKIPVAMSCVLMCSSTALIISVAAAQQQQGGQQRAGTAVYRGYSSGIALVSAAQIQEELGLSDKQREEIERLRVEVRRQMQEYAVRPANEFLNEGPEERRKFLDRRAEANRPAEESLARLLDDKQAKRFEQLKLHVQGARALTQKDAAEMINLGEDQRVAIQKIVTGADQTVRKMTEAYVTNNRMREERLEYLHKVEEVRQKANTEALEVLSDDQITKWKQMLGERFEFENLTLRTTFQSDY